MSPEHGDSTDEAQRLSVHLTNGPTVTCGNFKAIEEGVLLFSDAGREHVSGFVPYDELRFVLPTDDDIQPGTTNAAEGGADANETADRKEETDGIEAGGEAEPATEQSDSESQAADDVEVEGAEEAAAAEAREPDAATETADDDDEETTSEAASRAQATIENEERSSRAVDDLTSVNGIGEAYADDLRDAGIDSLDALAAADATDVSEAAGVSSERAEQWVADAAEASGADTAEEDADGTGAEA